VGSLVAEIRKETATIQSSFDKKSSEWDLIQAELVTRAQKEVELQQKLQNLKDQTNVLVRASTRTADMEKTQSNIYATLTELKASIALMKPVLEKLQS